MSLFKVSSRTEVDAQGKPKVIKVDKINPALHLHAAGHEFDKETLEEIKKQYGADAVVKTTAKGEKEAE